MRLRGVLRLALGFVQGERPRRLRGAELTARALLTMDIQLFLDRPDEDLTQLTGGLLRIWSRTLLLRDP